MNKKAALKLVEEDDPKYFLRYMWSCFGPTQHSYVFGTLKQACKTSHDPSPRAYNVFMTLDERPIIGEQYVEILPLNESALLHTMTINSYMGWQMKENRENFERRCFKVIASDSGSPYIPTKLLNEFAALGGIKHVMVKFKDNGLPSLTNKKALRYRPLKPVYTTKEVKDLLMQFHKEFCTGTGTESLRDDWILNNVL
jgi:hypothetical protein